MDDEDEDLSYDGGGDYTPPEDDDWEPAPAEGFSPPEQAEPPPPPPEPAEEQAAADEIENAPPYQVAGPPQPPPKKKDDDWEPAPPGGFGQPPATKEAAKIDDWEPAPKEGFKPLEPAKAESAWDTFMREVLHGAGPAVAAAATGIAGGVATQALIPIPGSGLVGGLVFGFGGGYAGETIKDKAAKAMGIDDDAMRAANIKEHPYAAAAGQAASNLAGFSPRGVATAATRLLGAGISAAGEAGAQIYQRGKEFFTPEGIKEAAPFIAAQGAAGAAAPNPYKWGQAIERGTTQAVSRLTGRPAIEARPAPDPSGQHGQTPGSEAGPGAPQEPRPPTTEPTGDPQNRTTIGGTGERERGGENLNTTGDRYAKPEPTPPHSADTEIPDAYRKPAYDTPAYTGEPTRAPETTSKGLNVGEGDPTVTHAIQESQSAPEQRGPPAEGRRADEGVVSEPRAAPDEAKPPAVAAARPDEAVRGPTPVEAGAVQHLSDRPTAELRDLHELPNLSPFMRTSIANELERRGTRPLPLEQTPTGHTVGQQLRAREAANRLATQRSTESALPPQKGAFRTIQNPDGTWALKNRDGNIVRDNLPDIGAVRREIAAVGQENLKGSTDRPSIQGMIRREPVEGGRGRGGRPIATERRTMTEQPEQGRYPILEKGAEKATGPRPPGELPPRRQAMERQPPNEFARLTDQELHARGQNPKTSTLQREAIINELQRRQSQRLTAQPAQTAQPVPAGARRQVPQVQPQPGGPGRGGPPPGGLPPGGGPRPAARQVPPTPPPPAAKKPLAAATPEDFRTGFTAAMQRWLGVTASSTPSGRAARNIIMKAEGRAEQEKQIAKHSFSDKMHRLLNTSSPTEQRMMVNYIQGGNHFPGYVPPKDFLPVVDALRKVYANYRDYITSLPKFQQQQFWNSNTYLTGHFKDPQGVAGFMSTYADSGPKAGGAGSLKQKKFPTDEDAISAGFEPVTHNPIERVLMYVDSMSKYMSWQQQLHEGKAAGYISHFAPESIGGAGTPNAPQRNAPPPGWARINGVVDEGGRSAYAPREFAETMNNFHSAGLSGAGVPREALDAWRRVSNAYTAVELLGPAYHAFTTLHETIAQPLGTAVSQVMAGRPDLAAISFAKGIAMPVTGFRTANRIRDIYLAGRDQAKLTSMNATPQERAIVDAMRDANWKPFGISHTLDYDMSRAGSAWTAALRGQFTPAKIKEEISRIYGAGDIKAGVMYPFRIAGQVMQAISQPLFEVVIPRLKAAAAFHNIKSWLDSNPTATPAELHEVSIKTLKNVDNFMGEMVHDNTMMNRAVRDIMSLGLRSPSFSIGGVIRGLGAGWASGIKGAYYGQNRASITSKNYDPRVASAIAYPLATGLLGLTYTYLKTGKIEQDDVMPAFMGTPHTGGTAPGVGGKKEIKEQALLPGYHKDVRAYLRPFTTEGGEFSQIGEELRNKMPGLTSSLLEQASNRRMTAYGPEPIVPPHASLKEWMETRAKAAGEKMLPIMGKQMIQTPRIGSKITYPEQIIGIRPPGTWQTDPEGYGKSAIDREEREWRRAEKAKNRDLQSRGLPQEPPRKFARGGPVQRSTGYHR
jgi:hypothetical protein